MGRDKAFSFSSQNHSRRVFNQGVGVLLFWANRIVRLKGGFSIGICSRLVYKFSSEVVQRKEKSANP